MNDTNNTPTPTPRTDAKVQDFENYVATFEDFIAHARQLERELRICKEWSDSKSEIIESLRFDLSEANLRLTIANDDAVGWEMLFDKAHAQKKGWQEVAEWFMDLHDEGEFRDEEGCPIPVGEIREKVRKLKEASK